MKEADKPAYPIKGINDEDYLEQCEIARGLTKRERFAMAAMQGLSANPAFEDAMTPVIADLAIAQADELLKQLEETQ